MNLRHFRKAAEGVTGSACARRLDYSGIAFLIMGSFVPWLYYSFYCSPQPCFIYLIVVCILGLAAITVSQCDFFATPQYRGVRAGRGNDRRSLARSLALCPRRAPFQPTAVCSQACL